MIQEQIKKENWMIRSKIPNKKNLKNFMNKKIVSATLFACMALELNASNTNQKRAVIEQHRAYDAMYPEIEQYVPNISILTKIEYYIFMDQIPGLKEDIFKEYTEKNKSIEEMKYETARRLDILLSAMIQQKRITRSTFK